jgi:hypothetical protein
MTVSLEKNVKWFQCFRYLIDGSIVLEMLLEQKRRVIPNTYLIVNCQSLSPSFAA